MSEMVERVARAIYVKRNGAGCTPWARQPRSHQEPYLSDARAAIEALTVPTEAMLDGSESEIDVSRYARLAIWTEMHHLALGLPIDANLPDPRLADAAR